jgi:hypothetical protein
MNRNHTRFQNDLLPLFINAALPANVVTMTVLFTQQRIVAKVDELMRWCDALEAHVTASHTTAEHLLDATLHQILAV